MLRVQEGRVGVHIGDDEGEKRIHGLVVCETCSKLWTRDYNAVRNIARAARADLNNEKRLSCLCKRRRNNPLDDMDWPTNCDDTGTQLSSLSKTFLAAILVCFIHHFAKSQD